MRTAPMDRRSVRQYRQVCAPGSRYRRPSDRDRDRRQSSPATWENSPLIAAGRAPARYEAADRFAAPRDHLVGNVQCDGGIPSDRQARGASDGPAMAAIADWLYAINVRHDLRKVFQLLPESIHFFHRSSDVNGFLQVDSAASSSAKQARNLHIGCSPGEQRCAGNGQQSARNITSA